MTVLAGRLGARPDAEPDMNRIPLGLASALLLSMVVHGVLLTGVRPGSMLDAERTSRSVQIRMLSAPDGEAPPAQTAPPPPAPPVPEATPLTAPREITKPGARAAALEPLRPAALSAAPVPRMAEIPRVPAPSLAATDAPPTPRVRASDYQLGAKLDPGPVPLGDIEPVFPPEAGLQEGSVVLRLFISEAGHVDDVVVLSSTPRGLFEKSALAAFGEAKFAPGRILGVAVKSQVTVEVSFTPFNRGAGVSGRTY